MGLLLKSGDSYYTVTNASYDTTNQVYTPIDTSTQDIKTLLANSTLTTTALFTETTIGTETFKPIDKFDTFSIVSDTDKSVAVKALKSYQELIFQSVTWDLNSNIVNYARGLQAISSSADIGDIRIAFSINGGGTWYGYKNLSQQTIANDVKPIKYEEMTEEDLVTYNDFKEVMSNYGFSLSDLGKLDLLQVNAKKLMVAILISTTTYEELPYLKRILLKYDEKHHMKKTTPQEVEINMHSAELELHSNIDSSYLDMHTFYSIVMNPNVISNKARLDTPVISFTENAEGNYTITWDAIEKATSYGIYSNGVLIKEITETSLVYDIERGRDENIFIRALDSTNSYISSFFSNVLFLSTGSFLGTNDNGEYKLICLLIDGEQVKIKVRK